MLTISQIAKPYSIHIDITHIRLRDSNYECHVDSICGINMIFPVYNRDGMPCLTVYFCCQYLSSHC